MQCSHSRDTEAAQRDARRGRASTGHGLTNAQRRTHTGTHAGTARTERPTQPPQPKTPEGPHIRSPAPRQRPGQ
eukprot:11606939-Alexandrium_andersonii.AAC.1